ncbi:hypothetical protein B5K08_17680 [Rhizobium leguminosarum bv. trifolii]|uniref:Uncharacterized protein n=1 Tax=Rhizobium leguminosarum bv. trifolii TaxID=386 RepID=A0A3E1BFH4_RHILT|nr:hypothetical protein B5K08_17680 [Rhizobium leguminosarum bv. trifolii]RFB91141.1 hypothetical protein B5K10_17675 [Rhizobium leguminosarum bv. trifolii]
MRVAVMDVGPREGDNGVKPMPERWQIHLNCGLERSGSSRATDGRRVIQGLPETIAWMVSNDG